MAQDPFLSKISEKFFLIPWLNSVTWPNPPLRQHVESCNNQLFGQTYHLDKIQDKKDIIFSLEKYGS